MLMQQQQQQHIELKMNEEMKRTERTDAKIVDHSVRGRQ